MAAPTFESSSPPPADRSARPRPDQSLRPVRQCKARKPGRRMAAPASEAGQGLQRPIPWAAGRGAAGNANDPHMSRFGERRGYHHGNLREALVAAAVDLISQHGPAGFTVAEAARLAGVSPGAPYRHFRDAEALLAEVALRGFERFAAALAAAWNDGRPNALPAFEALGRAYLAFARNEPAHYAAMFETRIAFDSHPGLLAAGDRAFSILREAAERLIATLPADR